MGPGRKPRRLVFSQRGSNCVDLQQGVQSKRFCVQFYSLFFKLHRCSRINEAKYFTISHVARRYICIKKCNFSSVTLLIMPRLSKHEQSGTIGMLQAGVRVSDIARYHTQRSLPGYRDSKRSTPVWSTKNYDTSSRRCTLAAFFVLWHNPFCVKIKEEETVYTNMTMPQLILPASLSIFW